MIKALFSFNGRLRRLAYFGYSILSWIVFGIVLVLGSAIDGRGGLGLTTIHCVPLLLWMTSAITVQRLHDMGFSGQHALWVIPISMGPAVLAKDLLTLVSFGLGLWLLFTRGEPEANAYGPPPVRGTAALPHPA